MLLCKSSKDKWDGSHARSFVSKTIKCMRCVHAWRGNHRRHTVYASSSSDRKRERARNALNWCYSKCSAFVTLNELYIKFGVRAPAEHLGRDFWHICLHSSNTKAMDSCAKYNANEIDRNIPLCLFFIIRRLEGKNGFLIPFHTSIWKWNQDEGRILLAALTVTCHSRRRRLRAEQQICMFAYPLRVSVLLPRRLMFSFVSSAKAIQFI